MHQHSLRSVPRGCCVTPVKESAHQKASVKLFLSAHSLCKMWITFTGWRLRSLKAICSVSKGGLCTVRNEWKGCLTLLILLTFLTLLTPHTPHHNSPEVHWSVLRPSCYTVSVQVHYCIAHTSMNTKMVCFILTGLNSLRQPELSVSVFRNSSSGFLKALLLFHSLSTALIMLRSGLWGHWSMIGSVPLIVFLA